MDCIDINDFSKICRCCLGRNTQQLRPLFEASLSEMLNTVMTTKITKHDEYPQNICTRCILKLSTSYGFRHTVMTSHKTLVQVLDVLKRKQMNDIENTINLEELENNILVTTNGTKEDNAKILELTSKPCFHSLEEEYQDTAGGQIVELVGHKDSSFRSFEEELETDVLLSNTSEEQNVEILVLNDESCLENLREEWLEEIPEAEEVVPSNQLQADDVIKCTHCEETFTNHVDKKIHLLQKHKEECSVCHKLVSLQTMRRHMLTHSGRKPYECELCSRRFVDASNFSQHKKSHTGEFQKIVGKPYLCNYCGRVYKWRTSLLKHLRLHLKKKVQTCDMCFKEFPDRHSLDSHMVCHTGVKRFRCAECPTRFTQRSNLTRHRLTHTKDKPYKCNSCTKSFSQKGTLLVHLRRHTGDKPYSCSECSRKFSWKNSLKLHMKSHENQRLKGDKTSNKLSIIPKHNLSIAFLCMICRCTFSTPDLLKEHVKCHEVVSVVTSQCKLCQQAFVNTASLITHYEEAHNLVVAEEDHESVSVCVKQLIFNTVDNCI